jgi:hypothetical protein
MTIFIILLMMLALSGLAYFIHFPVGILASNLLTASRTRPPRMTVGGISELYLGNAADLEEAGPVTYDGATGKIQSINLKESKAIYKYDFEKGTASVNQPLQVNANRYIQPAITASLAGYDQELATILFALAIGKFFAIVKLKGSGKYVAIGLPAKDGGGDYLEASANETSSGAAEGDLEGATFTLSCAAVAYGAEVPATEVSRLYTGVVVDSVAPLFASGFPTVTDILSTSFKANTQQNEAGKTYFVVLAAAATAPSATQVKNGQDSTGAAVAKSGSMTVNNAFTTYTQSVTGLTASTAYKVYFAAEDLKGNLNATVAVVDASTTA